MADVIVLFAAALLVLGGAVVLARTVQRGRRKRVLERSGRPARLRRELNEIDTYIRELGQAASDDDVDRLEHDKEQKRWDGSSSR
jgi:hypothetical protein